jgi:hypothetical protein
MFNNNGESQMFNKKKDEEKKEEKNVWLVIERCSYGTTEPTFSVAKKAFSLQDAIGFQVALEKLNDRDNQSYFIATEIKSGLNEVIKLHNKSVEDGSYYETK